MTFFLILSLTLSSSGLHITQEHGMFPSRPSCEDYLEDLALHLRLPADTKVRLECKRAPQPFASTQLTKPREKHPQDVR